MEMTKIKKLLTNNWQAKLLSLITAIVIWYMIRMHLESLRGDETRPWWTGEAPEEQSHMEREE